MDQNMSYYKTKALLSEFFYFLLNERLLVMKQVFKVDLEDHLIIHVDNCGPTGCAKMKNN
jgi:hypothetical protein